MSTEHYVRLRQSIEEVRAEASVASDLVLRLLFANVITVFEVYLQSVLLHLIERDAELMASVAKATKYKNHKLPLHFVLKNDPSQYLIALVKEINFHNLSDVEPLFREAFGIDIEITDEVLRLIRLRHDVVHRNGFTKSGAPCAIDEKTIRTVSEAFGHLAETIDRQIMASFKPLFA